MTTPSALFNALAALDGGQPISASDKLELIDVGYVQLRSGPLPVLTETGREALEHWNRTQAKLAFAHKQSDRILHRT